MPDIDYSKMLGEAFRATNSKARLHRIFKEAFGKMGVTQFRLMLQVMSEIMTDHNMEEHRKKGKEASRNKRSEFLKRKIAPPTKSSYVEAVEAPEPPTPPPKRKSQEQQLRERIREKLKGQYSES